MTISKHHLRYRAVVIPGHYIQITPTIPNVWVWHTQPYNSEKRMIMSFNAEESLREMQALAAAHGGKCLSNSYTNAHTKLQWECKNQHQWWATAHSVRGGNGSWCRICHQEELRLGLPAMQKLAAKRRGFCLSFKYVNANTPLRWLCELGHNWTAPPLAVKNDEKWCRQCATEEQRLSLTEMQDLATKRGGLCLSIEYINTHTNLDWQCRLGHKWPATPASIKYYDTWCPACARKEASEKQRGKKRGPTPKVTILDMQDLAALRGGKCLSEYYINKKAHLLWQCRFGHQWQATPDSVKHAKSWCPECFHEAQRLGLPEMQALALERGGFCLSFRYGNTHTPLRWLCELGHDWTAEPKNIKYDATWCPECAVAERRLGLAAMQALAIERGGLCLSGTYIDAFTSLLWQCSEGHQWPAIPNNVKNSGTWCPECAVDDTRLAIEEMHALAAERGGKCLSTEYVNSYVHLLWRCSKGHEWSATPDCIKNSRTWCPTCAVDGQRTT